MNTKKFKILTLILSLLLILTACEGPTQNTEVLGLQNENKSFVEVSENSPEFLKSEITTKSFERYSELDYLGRCGTAIACIGKDIMPTAEREAIGQVKPSGWQLVKYDNVDGKYLYNRCHLIGYQLTGENANEKNLITSTRYMNVEGMLPYENMVADYVKRTDNHVMYRVTPVFEGDNLLAKGVKMEAYSVEDNGAGICFNVFVFNVQPGININYSDGTSSPAEETDKNAFLKNNETENEYVLNKNTKKFHYKDCSSVDDIKEKNKEIFNGTKEELEQKGYKPCARCEP